MDHGRIQNNVLSIYNIYGWVSVLYIYILLCPIAWVTLAWTGWLAIPLCSDVYALLIQTIGGHCTIFQPFLPSKLKMYF